MPTNHIVEAHATVQLYINRMLEDIESGGFTDKDALKEEWETAQQYRVWQANEKLKLHPGNYIEPELRYNKTEIFKTFEQNLSQGYLDETMIETALYNYMQELQRLTELQPTGFCQVRKLSEFGSYIDYYFTAKANWSQMTYYYRRLQLDVEELNEKNPQATQWGEWKRIDLPATNQTVFGIHPAYAWNRLFLLWFELEERRSEDGQETKYHLIPRYTRQGVDGSFGEPFTPSMSQDIVGKLTSDQPIEPTIYQANLQEGKINLFFTVEKDKDRFLFEISQTDAMVSETNRVTPIPPELIGYKGTQSLYAKDEPQRLISPSQNKINAKPQMIVSGYYVNIDSGASLYKFIDVHYSLLDQGKRLKIEVKTARILFHRSSGSNKITSSVENVRYEVYLNGLQIDKEDCSTTFEESNAPNFSRYHRIHIPPPFVIDMKDQLTTEINVKLTFDYESMGVCDSYEAWAQPVINYQLTKTITDYMYLESSGTRKQEAYLVATDATDEGDRHIFHLVSPGLGNVPELLPLPAGVRPLFSLVNQSYPEIGVDNFLEKAGGNEDLSPILEPKPKDVFDFDGPMGLCGWEVFYHIPALLASKYADNGDYKQAKRWLRCIYDPSNPGNPWGVRPLILDQTNNGIFSITDPDREAVRNPIHYQQATIRHSLEHLLSQGDDAYRQETQETLQQAKMCYVVAKNFFREEFAQQLEILTASDWNDPTLENVSESDFRPPTNEELLALYQTIEERLHNLRHWLNIDGEPLNVPLLATPINPQQLQLLIRKKITRHQFRIYLTCFS